ncbi:unnamed protein product [Schistosoma rodhaini]|uniref:NF-kappa-B inhibitor-like protein 1 n=1 Tax=Schistosoma rodhaini TaxID=6188 RepID=A0AA85FGC6_9TREM|nr:unnamed protein product [Schistosoma rodhaini]
MYNCSNLETLFQNEEELKSIIIKLVRSGDISKLKILFQLVNASDSSCMNQWCSSKLAEIKDNKQRNLLHIACKYGHKEMIEYLVHKLRLPVTKVDQSGNNPGHILLIHALKSIKANYRKKRRRNSKCTIKNYIDCCELLKIVLHKHSNLLTISNKKGLKVIDLLQELWNYSSKTEREIGDNILKCILSGDNSYSNTPNIHNNNHPASSSSSSSSRLFKKTDYNDEMSSFLSDSDEANNSSNEWEDYFSGFSDERYISHLDSIREEFEHRKRTTSVPHKPPKYQQPQNKESKYTEFYGTFEAAEELSAARLLKQNSRQHLVENSYETYLEKWKQFLNSDQSTLLNYNDILWPPFCTVTQINSSESTHIESILEFVQYSSQSLRQLQVDWHPDKFSGRFGTRFKSESVKIKVMKRVVNISQLLNKATDYLRNKNEAK